MYSYHEKHSYVSLEKSAKSGIKFKFKVPDWAKEKINDGISLPNELLKHLKESKVEKSEKFKESIE